MKRLVAVLCVVILLAAGACSPEKPQSYALATAHPLATKAGREILEAGGNAFDAAVTVSAVLAVVEPYSSGFGGGGFWLLHRAADSKDVMIDGRETAPGKARRNMYLNAAGEFVAEKSLIGPLAAGIPGMPAALVHIAGHYGSMSLAEVLLPAIRYAERGFPADEKLVRYIEARQKILKASAGAARIFMPNGKIPKINQIIRQTDLADTMRRLAIEKTEGFYSGTVAERMVKSVKAGGGIWETEDLQNYRVIEREPISFSYRGALITSAAPPSSGGIALAEILNVASQFDLASMEHADRIHYLVEAMRSAYRDRALWLGDSDFFEVPTAKLISIEYAAELAADITADKARLSPGLSDEENRDAASGDNTTHFSILDAAGNRVAATLSINYPFGSGFVAAGTGVLLNNEMDDFSVKPGAPNVYGLVGGEANAIEPGKRMLSSMSPTFVDDGERIALLGTPGGSRIITMVALGILNFLAGGDAKAIVSAGRFHHQYLPDLITYEADALNIAEQTQLRLKGHKLKLHGKGYGNMQAVIWNYKDHHLDAASDPRGIGVAAVGHDK